ncbi:MAG: TlpA family protein disulfide reductase [Flavobacteriales bacterium]|nr:TlpA family protein disulfide reductase [Flavobacteriales bacterium]
MMMNKTAFLLLTLIVLIGVQNAHAQKGKMTTTFKGELLNAQRDFFILKTQGRSDSVKFGKDGKFEVLIEQNSGNYFTIEHGRQALEIYLLPADVFTVTMNSTSLTDATNMTGASAPYCKYLIGKQKADKSDNFKLQPFRTGVLDANTFFAKRDSIRLAHQNDLDKAAAENKFIKAFTDLETKSFDYQMGLEILNYKNNAAKNGISSFPIQFAQYTSKLSLNEEDMAFNHYFRQFALNEISEGALQKYYAGTDKEVMRYFENFLDILCERIKSEKIKSILISDMMPQVAKDAGVADMRPFVAKLEKCSGDPKLIASVKKLADQNAAIYPGQPAPDAVFYDANGKFSRISDYKGKVLYIDTWATWCGPCKREIPHLKTLEEEYHGKNVTFISVSTDKDINAWKSFIAKEQMAGLQLHQSDKFEETISKLYLVNSIPRFIIIDKNGKIVQADGPRPSSGETVRNLLDQLLAE